MEGTRLNFIDTLEEQYKKYCKDQEIEESIKGFAEYVINRNLITDKTVNRFLVVEKYPAVLKITYGIKYLAIWELESIVPLKETQILNIIKDYSVHYVYKNRLIRKT